MKKHVLAIIMGSDSDLAVMSDAARLLDEFHISYEITVVSAHRTPLRMVSYARNAEMKGMRVIIAGAGGAAHLPGMVASLSTLPVIGVPIKTRTLDGIDSLLSIIQMPLGIPVATVAINSAGNAALLALRILALSDSQLQEKLARYQKRMNAMVRKKAAKLKRVGYQSYLKST